MSQFIAGEKIEKWATVWLDKDWITLHNLLKTEQEKKDDRIFKIQCWVFSIIWLAYLLLYLKLAYILFPR
jgi:hypothetical protein